MAIMNTTSGIVYVRGIQGTLTQSGNLVFSPDGTYDIGATGATRPRNLYLSSGIYIQNNSSGLALGAVGAVANIMNGGGDGLIRLLDNAGTSFGRLMFGGTTSAFPSLKRVSADLHVRMADDSSDTSLQAFNLTASNALVAGTNASATGVIRIPNASDISARNAANNSNFSLIRLSSADKVVIDAGGAGVQLGADLQVATSTATPAGGSSAANLRIGSAGVGYYIGSGVPTVTAAKGSIYVNTTATTTTTRLYINTDGGTTWTAFTSAA